MFPIDHDLHCHTHLSGCSNDPKQSVANILAFAKAHNYLASDAHHPAELSLVPDIGPSVVSALGLGARHLFRLPV